MDHFTQVNKAMDYKPSLEHDWFGDPCAHPVEIKITVAKFMTM